MIINLGHIGLTGQLQPHNWSLFRVYYLCIIYVPSGKKVFDDKLFSFS